jgi:hypothetical protein
MTTRRNLLLSVIGAFSSALFTGTPAAIAAQPAAPALPVPDATPLAAAATNPDPAMASVRRLHGYGSTALRDLVHGTAPLPLNDVDVVYIHPGTMPLLESDERCIRLLAAHRPAKAPTGAERSAYLTTLAYLRDNGVLQPMPADTQEQDHRTWEPVYFPA